MIKERIIQLIEYKGIAKESFYKKIGVTSANFRGKAKESDIASASIAKILSEIPDLNLEWLITGNGEMLKRENSYNTDEVRLSDEGEQTDWEREYYKLMKELNDCLKKNNELLENKSQHAS